MNTFALGILIGSIIGGTIMLIGWFLDTRDKDRRAEENEKAAYDKGYRKGMKVKGEIDYIEEKLKQLIDQETSYSDLPVIGQYEPIDAELSIEL